jgi:uncharacterized membrane protein
LSTHRLEAFSDGVIAIIITIMVLEMKVPHGTDLEALRPLLPVLLSYALSYVYLGIYWNNHHHLLHTALEVDGRIMWANLHLLFWLSLVPFVTGWLGENGGEPWATALYGCVLFMAAISYTILSWTISAHDGETSQLAQAVGRDLKGKLSLLLYAAAIGLAFYWPWAAHGLFIAVALIWLVPDRRISEQLRGNVSGPRGEH